MPLNPLNGQYLRVSSSKTITALSVNATGQTVTNAPTALTVSSAGLTQPIGYAWVYITTAGGAINGPTWYRVQ
jgi:hypothetical protein